MKNLFSKNIKEEPNLYNIYIIYFLSNLMGELRVVMDPEQRGAYIDKLLALDGLSHVVEDPLAAYCPISLTSTPPELKPHILKRQELLMDNILTPAGICPYDPASAPFSPDTNLTSQPNEVYVVDSGKIVGARYFVGHNILPSTGQGIEAEKAKTFNRIPVILSDSSMRVSRMQPHRFIYLQYHNFEEQVEEFIPVFEMLQDYIPGMGFNGDLPTLVGFNGLDAPVDLEEKVYREFPELQYHYNGAVPILKLRAENPQLFYENN